MLNEVITYYWQSCRDVLWVTECKALELCAVGTTYVLETGA